MDEQQLRSLVRDAIARHLGPSPASVAAAPPVPVSAVYAASASGPIAVAQFHVPRRAGEVECVIEPTVTCNHCGHCLCYGH
jgi:hypothetical protein